MTVPIKRTLDLDQIGREIFTNTNRSSKKRRSEVKNDYSLFAPGSIIKIKVKNFVTYSSTEFTLSPSLNMIIGPNGTGKSTFVCALCLGLAGHPTLLGRQKTLAGFIKNGEESAVIEITLKGRNDNDIITITREIYQTGKSDWTLNHKDSNEQGIKTKLKEFNIQLDNLCQFLPQEKVADFAKLSPRELLMETQRAIDLDLLQQHEQLIVKDGQKQEIQKLYDAKMANKESLEKKKEQYEEDAKKYEEFRKKEKEKTLHASLLPYAQIQDMKESLKDLKKKRDSLKAELEDYKSKIKPFLVESNSFDEEIQDFANLIHDDSKKYKELEEDMKQLTDDIKKLESQNESCQNRIIEFRRRKQEKLESLQKYKKYLKDNQEQQTKLQTFDKEDVQASSAEAKELDEKRIALDEMINTEKGKLESSKFRIDNITRKIDNLQRQAKTNDRLHILSNPKNRTKNTDDAKRAVEILRNKFKDMRNKVFEPPCLTVTAITNEFAHYIETLLDQYTTLAFTCVDKQSYDSFSNELYKVQHINVPFRRLSGRSLSPRFTSEQLKDFGFEGYLKDFLIGPAPVIQMLSEENFIHTIPVSRRSFTQQQLDRLTKHFDDDGYPIFRKFFVGDTLYTMNRSKYGSRQVIIKTNTIRTNGIYFSTGGISDDRKRELRHQIEEAKNEREDLEEKLAPTKEKLRELKKEAVELQEQSDQCARFLRNAAAAKKEYDKLIGKEKTLKDKINTLVDESEKNYDTDIIKQERRIRHVLSQKILAYTKLAKLQSEANTAGQNLTILKVKKFEIENRQITMKALTKNFEETRRALEDRYAQAKRDFNSYKNSDQRIRLQNIVAEYSDELKEELKLLARKYTDEGKFTEASIQGMIRGFEASIKMLGNSSESSIKRFEKLKQDLAVLDGEIHEYHELLESLTKEMREIAQVWEPRLVELVSKIALKFSSIFPTVGIAGDVRIAPEERYQDWRLEILVKFREESDFKVLDNHTQSGGERAVSTVYYMISMQELTTSPFRAVDEINQGMDERNERIVHKHMVETACLEHTSQYFLITPKLLTNLYYAKNMRVHCIMAGPWIPDPRENSDYLSLGAATGYAL